MRTVGARTSFLYIDHEDTQTPKPFGTKGTEREEKAKFYRTCKCGVHDEKSIIGAGRKSSLFDATNREGIQLFGVGTKNGRLVRAIRKELERNKKQKKLGQTAALG